MKCSEFVMAPCWRWDDFSAEFWTDANEGDPWLSSEFRIWIAVLMSSASFAATACDNRAESKICPVWASLSDYLIIIIIITLRAKLRHSVL